MVRTIRPRHLLLIVLLALSIAACSTSQAPPGASGTTPPAAASDTPPANWEPNYWDRAMRDAQASRASGDRAAAERACARGILYVQAQTIKLLYSYADLLDVQNLGSGVPVRSKAQKLEQARDAQAQARTSGNTYLGFDPAAELRSYAELLGGMKRNTEALTVEALANAYRYAQDANLRRTLLQRDGKDPFGEC
ncbi:MAG TPA: hypothetical protein VLW55_11595 [Burkholderiaceae bacterium]|nr:hypothetical protein [Burkholderiaceae bacterium]